MLNGKWQYYWVSVSDKNKNNFTFFFHKSKFYSIQICLYQLLDSTSDMKYMQTCSILNTSICSKKKRILVFQIMLLNKNFWLPPTNNLSLSFFTQDKTFFYSQKKKKLSTKFIILYICLIVGKFLVLYQWSQFD